MNLWAKLAGLAAALAVTAGSARADGDPAQGAKVFRVCMACHRIGPGARALVGPPLNGIVGRPAGSIEGYSYTSAMRGSGLVFDEPTLTRYLTAPREVVPGTAMIFGGIKKPDDLANLVAYLKSFDAEGKHAAPAP